MKRIAFLLVSLLLFLIVTVASINEMKLRDRAVSSVVLSDYMKQQIDTYTASMNDDEIIRYCVRFTSDCLSFSRKDNCVVYANLCSSLCNYAFKKKGVEGTARPVIGKVKILGIDMCPLLYGLTGDRFFINHDFTEIRLSGRVVWVDPSCYDLLYNMCWNEHKT